jgi:hypothetical protein
MGVWDKYGHYGDWMWGCGVDSAGSAQGPLAGSCECGTELHSCISHEQVHKKPLPKSSFKKATYAKKVLL